MQTLLDAEFFIGVSSGLSWLSWSVNTHAFLISDVTPLNHEFHNGITRISCNPHIETIDYGLENVTTTDSVINHIKEYMSSINELD